MPDVRRPRLPRPLGEEPTARAGTVGSYHRPAHRTHLLAADARTWPTWTGCRSGSARTASSRGSGLVGEVLVVGLSGLEPLTSALSGPAATRRNSYSRPRNVHQRPPASAGWRRRCHTPSHAFPEAPAASPSPGHVGRATPLRASLVRSAKARLRGEEAPLGGCIRKPCKRLAVSSSERGLTSGTVSAWRVARLSMPDQRLSVGPGPWPPLEEHCRSGGRAPGRRCVHGG
jgi:hypothetical protein